MGRDLEVSVDFGVFDDMSSAQLLDLSKPIEIMLAVGKKDPIFLNVKISPPAMSDIKWSNSLKNKSASKRARLLEKAIKDNNLWRISYLCKTYQEKDYDKNWLDPNKCFEWVTYRSLLSSACNSGTVEGVALLLQCRDINVNHNFAAGAFCFDNALNRLLYRTDHENGAGILRMLIKLDLKIDLRNINTYVELGKTKDIKDLLEGVVRNREEHKVRTLPPPDKAKNVATWKKLDGESICKLTSNDDFRIRKVFNFLNSTVSECNEYLDENNKVMTATQPIITPMSRVSCKKEIKQAQTHLKNLNTV